MKMVAVSLFCVHLFQLLKQLQITEGAKGCICVTFQTFMAPHHSYYSQPGSMTPLKFDKTAKGPKSNKTKPHAGTSQKGPSNWNYVKQFYQCQKCNKTFDDVPSLNKHVYRQHEQAAKTEKCNYCNRTFLHHSSWLRHVRTHEGIYKHKCDVCQQGFTEKYQLEAHIAAKHGSGDFLFSCPVCNVGFNYKGNMTAHMKKAHPNNQSYSPT